MSGEIFFQVRRRHCHMAIKAVFLVPHDLQSKDLVLLQALKYLSKTARHELWRQSRR